MQTRHAGMRTERADAGTEISKNNEVIRLLLPLSPRRFLINDTAKAVGSKKFLYAAVQSVLTPLLSAQVLISEIAFTTLLKDLDRVISRNLTLK